MNKTSYDSTYVKGKMSVSLPKNVGIISQELIHTHKKFTILVAEPTQEIKLPTGEYYLPSSNGSNVSVNSVQVYINGILQTNGINFDEVHDPSDPNVCNGISIPDELLLPGDYVTMEWTVMEVR